MAGARVSGLLTRAVGAVRALCNVVVPERAYALLGYGRCFGALGDPAADQPLAQARELCASMGYAPALAETDALLHQAEAAVSRRHAGLCEGPYAWTRAEAPSSEASASRTGTCRPTKIGVSRSV